MERKASEVFMDLWHQVSLGQMESEDFTECAEAWAQIRAYECEEKLREEQMKAFDALQAFGEKPIGYEREVKPEPIEDTDEGSQEIQIDQHTFADEETVEAEIKKAKEDGGEPEEKQEAKPVTWSDQQNAVRKRKQEILQRLRWARENHVSGPKIAEAAGVDNTKIYAILNAGQVTIQTYEKVAKGLEKLGY